MVVQWGLVPLAYLAKFSGEKYIYGYIGSEDFTMYPLLPPGTFLQVDESRSKVECRECGAPNMSVRSISWKPAKVIPVRGAR